MLEFLGGFVVGAVVAAVVAVVMKKKDSDKLDAFLDLDWDMDGESGEIFAKIKAGKDDLVEKVKAQIDKVKK